MKCAITKWYKKEKKGFNIGTVFVLTTCLKTSFKTNYNKFAYKLKCPTKRIESVLFVVQGHTTLFGNLLGYDTRRFGTVNKKLFGLEIETKCQ